MITTGFSLVSRKRWIRGFRMYRIKQKEVKKGDLQTEHEVEEERKSEIRGEKDE